MHFSSFSSLSLIFFVLYSCRPTAAATLAASPVKRGNPYDALQCPGPLPKKNPKNIPLDFRPPTDLLEMCGIKGGRPENLGCKCIVNLLICGSSPSPTIQRLLDRCFAYCTCGPNTAISRSTITQEIRATWLTIGEAGGLGQGLGRPRAPNPHRAPSGNRPTGSNPTSACSKTCTAVNRDCDRFFTGDCKCYAPPTGLVYWHSGNCGPVHTRPHSPKRDLAQQRRSYYLNVTAPAGFPPDLTAQLASGLLPSPCNVSYVSFACSDSLDGIVHEPPQSWLGALLPEGAEELLPPVPEEFLRTRRLEKGELQVAMVDVK